MVNGHTPFEQQNEWSNNVSSKSTPTMSEMLWEGDRKKMRDKLVGMTLLKGHGQMTVFLQLAKLSSDIHQIDRTVRIIHFLKNGLAVSPNEIQMGFFFGKIIFFYTQSRIQWQQKYINTNYVLLCTYVVCITRINGSF